MSLAELSHFKDFWSRQFRLKGFFSRPSVARLTLRGFGSFSQLSQRSILNKKIQKRETIF